MKKICIVTSRHISYNPRVLKEADAFFAKGYQVSVVTINNHLEQNKFDEEMMKTRLWKLKTVNFRKDIKSEKLAWLNFTIKQKFYSFLALFFFRLGIPERASIKGYGALVKLAKKEAADFYIVHHAEVLGIGYEAAKSANAKLGFDAEDFHSGMNESGDISKEDEIITYLEKKYLPYCSYFTAASKGIMEAYVSKYGIKEGNVILNVFPSQRLNLPAPKEVVRFYWYSQTIGSNRSLEILMEATAKIKAPFEVHLRGSFNNDAYKKELLFLIGHLKLKDKVFFHEPILAEDIIKDASKFDVGLALESDVSQNRNICVTNKIFSYLMSGLAIIGTDTYGQKDIFTHFEEAVVLCKKNDVNDLSRAMLVYIQNHDKLLQAKTAARKVAEEQFNWECESGKLITHFEQSFFIKAKRQSIVNN